MDKYFKNFILCGDIDYYCLLCQELFRSISHVEKHIRWEKHRKTLKDQAYFPKFRKDSIYKVGNQFYCEICNFVTSNTVAISEHIKNESHKAMKTNVKPEPKNFIGQYDCGYVVIKKVILNMSQWNSIVEKKCHLCDIIVLDIDEHIVLGEHIIKLLQSETKYDDERYYRKINEDKYHCFTCKKIYYTEKFHNHWSNCENVDEIEIKKLKEVGSNKDTDTLSNDIEKKLIETLQEFYYIEEKNNFATCKYCSTCVAINFKSMIEHMKNKHDNDNQESKVTSKKIGFDESSEDEVVYVKVTDSGKRRSELAQYGKMHSIKLNYNGSKGWCMLCDKYLSAHKNIFREHIKGAIHKGHLELQSEGLKNPKKRSSQKYKSKSILQYSFKYAYEKRAFWIDSDYSIDVYSFFLLVPIENDPHFKKTKCFACNELFPQGQERDHCATLTHKKNFLAAKVVNISEKVEFTREIRPNLFHCGYCNETLPFSETMIKHIKTSFKHEQRVVFSHLERSEGLKEEKSGSCRNTFPISSKNEDNVYMQLLLYGFINTGSQ